MRSVITSYDSAAPGDVASTGTACGSALSGLQGSSLLGKQPAPGKDLAARQDLHMAYLQARQGFSSCATGAKAMNYTLMARGDSELMSANTSLSLARSAK
jgi:hypothetical protein